MAPSPVLVAAVDMGAGPLGEPGPCCAAATEGVATGGKLELGEPTPADTLAAAAPGAVPGAAP